jgi:hypothetical protein
MAKRHPPLHEAADYAFGQSALREKAPVAVTEMNSKEASANVTSCLRIYLKTCLAVTVAAAVGLPAFPVNARSRHHHYRYHFYGYHYGYPHDHGNYSPYAYGSYGPYTPNLPSPPHGVSPDFQSGGYR